LVWLDKRTSDIVHSIIDINGGSPDAYRSICGLPINTYFSAVKMKWLLDNVKAV